MAKIPERLEPAGINRASRRLNRKLSPCVKVEDAVITAFTGYEKANQARSDSRRVAPYGSLSAAIFQGSQAGVRFVAASRNLSNTMGGVKLAELCKPHQEWFNRIKFTDLYKHPVGGTSLSDIETLPLPLEDSGILRINRLLRRPFLPFLDWENINDRRVREAVIYTAVEPTAHSEIVAQGSISGLRQRVTGYFEFYKQFLTARDTDTKQDWNFLQTLLWTGRLFGQGLSLYLAADLGLSPASVIKLFREKVARAGNWAADYILQDILAELKYAYHTSSPDALPVELHPYLQYHPRSDKQAALLLIESYSRSSKQSPNPEPAFTHQDAETLIEKLRKYRRVIYEDMLSSANPFLTIPVENYPPITSFVLALRDSKSRYRGSFLFVLFLNRQQTHLTLELPAGDNRLYGLPPELSRAVPHINEFLVRDIVGTIVNQAEQQHPELKPKPSIVTSYQPRQAADTTPAQNASAINGGEDAVDIEPEKPLKRKYLRRLVGLDNSEPELPKPDKTYGPANTVSYDQVSIQAQIPKARAADVQRIMDAIRRFETGGVRRKKLVDGGGIYRLVAGKYRIKLRYLGGNSYAFSEVALRKEAY